MIVRPRFLARLISAYHLVKARDDQFALGPEAALQRLAKMERLIPLRASEMAYKAQLLLILDRKAEADELFARALETIGQPKNANQRYVQIICLLWKDDHFDDLDEADRIWLEAGTLPCSDMLREYLLLYDRMPSEVVANPTRITRH